MSADIQRNDKEDYLRRYVPHDGGLTVVSNGNEIVLPPGTSIRIRPHVGKYAFIDYAEPPFVNPQSSARVSGDNAANNGEGLYAFPMDKRRVFDLDEMPVARAEDIIWPLRDSLRGVIGNITDQTPVKLPFTTSPDLRLRDLEVSGALGVQSIAQLIEFACGRLGTPITDIEEIRRLVNRALDTRRTPFSLRRPPLLRSEALEQGKGWPVPIGEYRY